MSNPFAALLGGGAASSSEDEDAQQQGKKVAAQGKAKTKNKKNLRAQRHQANGSSSISSRRLEPYSFSGTTTSNGLPDYTLAVVDDHTVVARDAHGRNIVTMHYESDAELISEEFREMIKAAVQLTLADASAAVVESEPMGWTEEHSPGQEETEDWAATLRDLEASEQQQRQRISNDNKQQGRSTAAVSSTRSQQQQQQQQIDEDARSLFSRLLAEGEKASREAEDAAYALQLQQEEEAAAAAHRAMYTATSNGRKKNKKAPFVQETKPSGLAQLPAMAPPKSSKQQVVAAAPEKKKPPVITAPSIAAAATPSWSAPRPDTVPMPSKLINSSISRPSIKPPGAAAAPVVQQQQQQQQQQPVLDAAKARAIVAQHWPTLDNAVATKPQASPRPSLPPHSYTTTRVRAKEAPATRPIEHRPPVDDTQDIMNLDDLEDASPRTMAAIQAVDAEADLALSGYRRLGDELVVMSQHFNENDDEAREKDQSKPANIRFLEELFPGLNLMNELEEGMVERAREEAGEKTVVLANKMAEIDAARREAAAGKKRQPYTEDQRLLSADILRKYLSRDKDGVSVGLKLRNDFWQHLPQSEEERKPYDRRSMENLVGDMLLRGWKLESVTNHQKWIRNIGSRKQVITLPKTPSDYRWTEKCNSMLMFYDKQALMWRREALEELQSQRQQTQ